MANRLLENKAAIDEYAVQFCRRLLMSAAQWEILEEFRDLVKPIGEWHLNLCLDKAPLSSQIAMRRSQADEWSKPYQGRLVAERARMKNILQEKLKGAESYRSYGLSHFLDPRYKDAVVDNPAQFREDIKTWLAAETPAVFAGPEVEFIRDLREPQAKKSFLGTVGAKYARGGPSTSSASQPQPRSKTVDQEYQAYICEATEDWESNPVDWWRFNKDRYPHLAAIARRYLTAPATSIASEQLFSTANLVYDDHRCRLSPQKAEMLIFLNRNLPILRYRY